jgi:hypothetical protein
MGTHQLPVQRSARLVLVALLGLTLALASVSAGHATSGTAVAAKKKCKKKGKKSADAAKKKKCKKKKVHTIVLPPPGPVVRGTVSWPEGDLDLNVFDASGNQAGYQSPPNAVVNNIPDSSHSGDVTNGGSESFTDNIFVAGGPSNRKFAYAVCFFHDDTATFTGVTSTGTTETLTRTYSAGVQWNITETGGPPVPASFHCPA